MSDKIIHLTDGSFDTDVLKAEGPILVDFWLNGVGRAR
ncbi:Thioredoxin-1 [Serratia plymuthica]|nr:Thioredoxin-1 [Serratia plymuthica]